MHENWKSSFKADDFQRLVLLNTSAIYVYMRNAIILTMYFDVESGIGCNRHTVVGQALICSHMHTIDTGYVERMAGHWRRWKTDICMMSYLDDCQQAPEEGSIERSQCAIPEIVWPLYELPLHSLQMPLHQWIKLTKLTLPCSHRNCFAIQASPFDMRFRIACCRATQS